MNTFEIVILAIALVLSAMPVNTLAGYLLSSETFFGKLKFVGIMFVISFLMSGAGIWIGNKTSSDYQQTNMWISLGLLLSFGLKVFLSSLQSNTEDKSIDFTDNNVLLITALTEGIIPLGIGIAIGILSQTPLFHWIILGIILFLGVISGFLLGIAKGSIISKFRFGLTGGLLIIATAIKLIITLVGY